MYRIAVCEDDSKEQDEIVCMTKKILQENEIKCDIFKYESGEELLTAIKNGTQFQLLLIDVLLKGINGIELAAELRRQKEKTAIVFISWNWEMALQGYEVAASRYIGKPIQEDRLREAVLFCYENQKKIEILLPTLHGECRISISDIVYAEAQGRGVKLILINEELKVNLKISQLNELLASQQFVLCHRAYLVNLEFVQYIRRYEIELKDGKILPVSKYRISEIKEKLIGYLTD